MMRKKHTFVSGKHVVIVACALLVMTFLTSYQTRKHDSRKDFGIYAYAQDKFENDSVNEFDKEDVTRR